MEVSFVSTSTLRKLRGREQVAAVCYRISERGIEFLLVRTRSGRWTFPKGGAEPGLTYAQAAALEAYEEAGVHGRIEDAAFARYQRLSKAATKIQRNSVPVHAHLCEVTRLSRPKESKRYPTWFSAEKAKRQLRAERNADDARELAEVVDRAVFRIERLRYLAAAPPDSLQRVQLEFSEETQILRRLARTAVVGYFRRTTKASVDEIGMAPGAQHSKVLRFNSPRRNGQPPLLLGTGKTLPALAGGKKKS
jgi:8-oxo-dGTP pyrophosphatase MutT (NUDIX family)